MERKNKHKLLLFIGITLGIISIITSFIESLSDFTLTAFLLSIFTLFHEFYSRIQERLEETDNHSSEMSKDVKNRLQVIRLEKPAATFDNYVIQRLDVISSIKNTSFNKKNNHREADEYFNETTELTNAPDIIKTHIANGLKWYDIGDDVAKPRFSIWNDKLKSSNSNSGYYKYSIINNPVPYPNFLIITYKDEREEVLFNWDFRSQGIKPDVLVSNEKDLVNFYSSQFELLLDNASPDNDFLD